MIDLYGMHVYLDENLGKRVQFRVPRTKNRRIRKKWARRPENWRFVPDPKAHKIGNYLYVHPVTWSRFRQATGMEVSPSAEGILEGRLRPPLDRLFEESWRRNEAGYRFLASR